MIFFNTRIDFKCLQCIAACAVWVDSTNNSCEEENWLPQTLLLADSKKFHIKTGSPVTQLLHIF